MEWTPTNKPKRGANTPRPDRVASYPLMRQAKTKPKKGQGKSFRREKEG